MLRKKEAYTVVTPIPGFIPRQLAIDMLHAHSEVITLNPLVLSHRPVAAPRTAAADEFYSTWYEIVERIQYVPGLGRAGAGHISFCSCFHDLPWGLQTHIYAPLGIDLRNRYRVASNQPGVERPDARRELGLEELGAPRDGLYLREDIEIRCNIAMLTFVKSQLRAASRQMLARFVKKAELLDAGVLRAMMEHGRLKTLNPNDRSLPGPLPAAAEPVRALYPYRDSYHDPDHVKPCRTSHAAPCAVELPAHDAAHDQAPPYKLLARPVSEIHAALHLPPSPGPGLLRPAELPAHGGHGNPAPPS